MNRPLARAPTLSWVLLALLALGGCYTYRTAVQESPPKTDSGEVVWSFAWGLLQEERDSVSCPSHALAEVTAKTNYLYAFVTVISIGLFSPQRIEWSCAGADPTDAEVDTTVIFDTTLAVPDTGSPLGNTPPIGAPTEALDP